MTGEEAYRNKYDRLSNRRIEKVDSDWMLSGFYNSLLIKSSYKTAYEYLSYVINFLETFNCSPEEISVDHYYTYMASIKNASSSKQIGAYHALQKYSKYLSARNISDDFMKYIDRPRFIEKQETINKREHGFLTKTETKKMLARVNNDHQSEIWKARNYAIIMIFLTTGIRCSALYKLDVNNVNMDKKEITVHEKGYKDRIISIPDQTVDAIAEWLKYRSILLEGNANEPALILSNRKRRMEAESIYVLIKNMGKVITGKNITPHKLRATYGTQLYNKTKDIYFVQQCMGHSNPKTTEIYIRGQKTEMSKKAANLMDDFLN